MRPLRILGLMPDGYGGRFGISQFNRHLLDSLAEDPRTLVRALALNGDPRAAAHPRVRWSIPAPGSKVGFALAAWRAAIAMRPHVVISGLVGFGTLAASIAVACRSQLWSCTHGYDVWDPLPWWDDLGLRRSNLITTVSRYTRDRLLGWSGIDPRRVRVLHNAIDLERFRPGPRPPELVERYQVEGRRVLLTIARLDSKERYKGHDRVLPLVSELNRQLGPVTYLIVGRGDDQPRVEAIARDCGALPFTTFAGFVPDAELEAHYRLADVYVMPSTGEGFGIVFLEAMACGCPVIAGNRDGSVDALADGELGRLVNPDSREELYAALVATLDSPRRHDRPIEGVERFSISSFRGHVGELVDALASAELSRA